MNIKRLILIILAIIIGVSGTSMPVFAEDKAELEKRLDFYGNNEISPYLMFDNCSTDETSSSDDSSVTGEGDEIEVGASRFSDGTGYRGDKLAGKKGYAELSTNPKAKDFSAIADLMKIPESKRDKRGGLPHKTKLKITYKKTGKSIVAEKLDVGSGGGDVKGKKRAVDLTSTAADALGLTNAIGVDVITIQLVSDSETTASNNKPSNSSLASQELPSKEQSDSSTKVNKNYFADTRIEKPVATFAADSSSNDKYFEKYAGYAYATGQKYKLPWEAVLAQSALESAWGGSALTKKANNFFGFKAGSSWSGDTITMRTREEKNGSSYYVNAKFRKYASPQEGFDDYGKMITTLSNYKNALKYPNDPEKYIQAIKDGGYATDGKYVSKVTTVIKQVREFAKKHGDKWKPSIPDDSADPECGGDTGDSGGGVGVADGFTFPLKTTKAVIKKGIQGAVWCFKSQTNCHHDYNAADIFAPTDTPIIAAKGGVVQALRPDSGNCTSRSTGCNVQIMGEDNILYYYTHMAKPGVVKKGQKVKAGEKIGAVGTNRTAMNTPSHLHFDMLPGDKYKYRVGCAGAACAGYPLKNVQPYLTKAFEALPDK